jgi:hypothetical protein
VPKDLVMRRSPGTFEADEPQVARTNQRDPTGKVPRRRKFGPSPTRTIGAPVLDADAEPLSWDALSHSVSSRGNSPWRSGDPWAYVAVRRGA